MEQLTPPGANVLSSLQTETGRQIQITFSGGGFLVNKQNALETFLFLDERLDFDLSPSLETEPRFKTMALNHALTWPNPL